MVTRDDEIDRVGVMVRSDAALSVFRVRDAVSFVSAVFACVANVCRPLMTITSVVRTIGR